MNCGRKVKFLPAQHRTLAVSQQRRIIVAAKLLAEKRLVDEDAVGTDEVIRIAGHRKRWCNWDIVDVVADAEDVPSSMLV